MRYGPSFLRVLTLNDSQERMLTQSLYDEKVQKFFPLSCVIMLALGEMLPNAFQHVALDILSIWC